MSTRWLDRRIGRPGPYLALVLSQKEFDCAMKRLGISPGAHWIRGGRGDAVAHILRNHEGNLAVVVAIQAGAERSPIEIAGLLVHEAVHVWQYYAKEIGEDSPGEEQEAYAIQAVAQELMAEYARRIS